MRPLCVGVSAGAVGPSLRLGTQRKCSVSALPPRALRCHETPLVALDRPRQRAFGPTACLRPVRPPSRRRIPVLIAGRAPKSSSVRGQRFPPRWLGALRLAERDVAVVGPGHRPWRLVDSRLLEELSGNIRVATGEYGRDAFVPAFRSTSGLACPTPCQCVRPFPRQMCFGSRRSAVRIRPPRLSEVPFPVRKAASRPPVRPGGRSRRKRDLCLFVPFPGPAMSASRRAFAASCRFPRWCRRPS
jgi:hypothetical protein